MLKDFVEFEAQLIKEEGSGKREPKFSSTLAKILKT